MLLAGMLLLTWLDPSNPVGTTYNVYRAPGVCSDFSTFQKMNATPVVVKNYKDSVFPGSYCYRVSAVVDGAESDPSAPVNVSTKPSPPSGLTVVNSPG